MKTLNLKAVIYARFSSSAQREESIDTQVRACTEYADQNGMTVVRVYADHAKSGRTANRPEFQRMIRDSASGAFDAVILYTIDRFARNRLDSAMYKAKLKKNGVRVLYARQPISEEPEGIILESIMEGYAEYYSASLARSVKGGMKENALKAHSTGGNFPLGYTKAPDGSFVLVPAEADAVRLAFELCSKRTSKQRIADALNAKGYRKKDGSLFTRKSFETLLRNPKYYGLYKYDDITVENGMPAIITKQLYDEVQAVLTETARAKARYKAKEDYLLSTRVFCGCCQSPMIGESGTGRSGAVYRYYKCAKQKKGQSCPKRPVKKELLERAVVDAVVQNVLTDETIDRIAERAVAIMEKEAAENSARKELEARLRDVEKALRNLLSAVERGLESESVQARINEREREKKALEKDLAILAAETPVLTKEQIAFWLYRYKKRDAESPSYDRSIIEGLVNRVCVSDLPDGKQELTILCNLSENNTTRITVSDLESMVHQARQYSNQPVLFPRKKIVAISLII